MALPAERVPASISTATGHSPAGAIVVGGDYKALGLVRSLGRRGVPVWVLTDDHRLAATSHYCRAAHPLRGTAEAGQLATLDALPACVNGWAVFPCRDDAVETIARHHATLGRRFCLSTPPWSVVRWAADKRLTYQLAGQIGLHAPWTAYPANADEVRALDCRFPVILKPATKVRTNRFTQAKAWRVDSRAALLAGYEAACRLVEPDEVMVQALIPGGGAQQFAFAALCDAGEVLASLTVRRTRQYPMDFGRASTFVESVEEPRIEAAARRLLAALRFTGLIEVEFKRDPRDGRDCLLDVNPRLWGWHTLGPAAGVDFGYLAWRQLRGETVAPARGRPGRRWVRLATDLPAVLGEIRRGRLNPLAVGGSLRPGVTPAVFAPDDPLPALLEAPLLLQLAWRRRAMKEIG